MTGHGTKFGARRNTGANRVAIAHATLHAGDQCPECRRGKVYRQKEPAKSSDSGVKLEQATESVATVNGPALRRYVRRRKEEKIAFALVVPFQMMMIDVLVQRPA